MVVRKAPTPETAAVALQEWKQDNYLPEVFEVKNNVSNQSAGLLLREVKGQQANLKMLKDAIVAPLKQSLKAVDDLFRPEETRLSSFEMSLKRGISTFLNEQQRLARLAEARLRDEHAAEEAKLLARAAKLEERGKLEQAEAVRDSIPSVPVVIADIDKVEGISSRGIWKAEVVSMHDLIVAILAGRAPQEYVMANQPALNTMARTMRKNANVPGVRVYEDKVVAARA